MAVADPQTEPAESVESKSGIFDALQGIALGVGAKTRSHHKGWRGGAYGEGAARMASMA